MSTKLEKPRSPLVSIGFVLRLFAALLILASRQPALGLVMAGLLSGAFYFAAKAAILRRFANQQSTTNGSLVASVLGRLGWESAIWVGASLALNLVAYPSRAAEHLGAFVGVLIFAYIFTTVSLLVQWGNIKKSGRPKLDSTAAVAPSPVSTERVKLPPSHVSPPPIPQRRDEPQKGESSWSHFRSAGNVPLPYLWDKIRQSAENGDAHAAMLCAEKATSKAEALRWLERAAELGRSDAAKAAAKIHLAGELDGLPRPQAAFAYFSQAARSGDDESQLFVAEALANGNNGAPGQNPGEAVKHWRKAAELGNARAQLALGKCYLEGSGVPQNWVEAYVWLNLAASVLPEARAARDAAAANLTAEQVVRAQEKAMSLAARRGYLA
jgi:tetratricopeptide (TPR) repeat protein